MENLIIPKRQKLLLNYDIDIEEQTITFMLLRSSSAIINKKHEKQITDIVNNYDVELYEKKEEDGILKINIKMSNPGHKYFIISLNNELVEEVIGKFID